MITVEYSENNSGGKRWLTTEQDEALFKAGFKRTDTDRFAGLLDAIIDVEKPVVSLREMYERATP